jgi:hypothetical protein
MSQHTLAIYRADSLTFFIYNTRQSVTIDPCTIVPMDEEIERDHTSGGGGLPTLPGLNVSTIQPSRRGFYRIHVCGGEDNWRQYI